MIGVAFLYAFIQCNYTGPDLDSLDSTNLLPNVISNQKLIDYSLKYLASDGEDAYHLLIKPELLFFARVLLVDSIDHLTSLKVNLIILYYICYLQYYLISPLFSFFGTMDSNVF